MTATEAYEFNICAETEDVLAFFHARGGGGTAGVTSTAAQSANACAMSLCDYCAERWERTTLSATGAVRNEIESLFSATPNSCFSIPQHLKFRTSARKPEKRLKIQSDHQQ